MACLAQNLLHRSISCCLFRLTEGMIARVLYYGRGKSGCFKYGTRAIFLTYLFYYKTGTDISVDKSTGSRTNRSRSVYGFSTMRASRQFSVSNLYKGVSQEFFRIIPSYNQAHIYVGTTLNGTTRAMCLSAFTTYIRTERVFFIQAFFSIAKHNLTMDEWELLL